VAPGMVSFCDLSMRLCFHVGRDASARLIAVSKAAAKLKARSVLKYRLCNLAEGEPIHYLNVEQKGRF
jgi:hypothetical protein